MSQGNFSDSGLPDTWAKNLERLKSLSVQPAPSDKQAAMVDTDRMTDITREELNAKLETIEVKMDARVEAVVSKIDTFLAVQAERDQRFNERLNSSIALSDEWNQKFRMLAEQSVQAAASADASAKEAATLKTHFWASVIAQLLAVGAIVVGAYFANQANVLSAVSTTVSVFQAGKDQVKSPETQAPEK
ncbi:hypothetical protein [Pseudomonas auratipiscis]|uniref:Uncharacterized protein n=1 Tax=Pseudomonas auratipiscis TaxID=3115853 RepID=A0AB35WU44_9PSED|nr:MULTISPECIES: hypothetical protein [unclassified Pseudomonas]MEE1866907.1 hypothetical protein [Pseudomonas sp. 120P]MEE1960605.1 hypothetical protein [Pseudomonas sp. 119P]